MSTDRIEATVQTLTAHGRPVRLAVFNHDSDLVFTADLAGDCFAWRTSTGERLMTYEGTSAAIESIDVTRDGKIIAVYSIENNIWFYEVETGKMIAELPHTAFSRGCLQFALGDSKLMVIENPPGSRRDVPAHLYIYDVSKIAEGKIELLSNHDLLTGQRAIRGLWGPLNESVIIAYGNGLIIKIDPETGEILKDLQLEADEIFSLCPTWDRSGVILCCDMVAVLIDTRDFEVVAEYSCEVLVRSATLHPTLPLMALGGGVDPKQAALSSSSIGQQFKIQFIDARVSAMLGSLGGHRGTIHVISISRDGLHMVSGCEDSSVLLTKFDPSILSWK